MKKYEEILEKLKEGGFMSLSLKELSRYKRRGSKIPKGSKKRRKVICWMNL